MTGLFVVLALLVAFMLGYLHGRWVWRDSPVKRGLVQSKVPDVILNHPLAGKPRTPPAYECPVCGDEDRYAYMRCNRPGCTDGRDPR